HLGGCKSAVNGPRAERIESSLWACLTSPKVQGISGRAKTHSLTRHLADSISQWNERSSRVLCSRARESGPPVLDSDRRDTGRGWPQRSQVQPRVASPSRIVTGGALEGTGLAGSPLSASKSIVFISGISSSPVYTNFHACFVIAKVT